MRIPVLIFILVFGSTIFAQSQIWQEKEFTDRDIWLERLELYHQDSIRGEYSHQFLNYSNHPGITVLEIANQFIKLLQFSPDRALLAASILIVALAAAGSATCAYLLVPSRKWWVLVGVMVGAHHSLVGTSPTSLAAIVLLPSALLLGLYYLKNKSNASLVVLAIVTALAVLSRWPATFIILGPVWLLVLWTSTIKQSALAILVLLVSTLIVDPFLTINPLIHFQKIIGRSFRIYDADYVSQPVRLLSLLLQSGLAVVSLFIGILHAWHNKQKVERSFFAGLVISTAVFAFLFLKAEQQVVRHWYPLLVSWEVLLPYWLLKLKVKEGVFDFVLIILLIGQLFLTASLLN